MSELTKEQVESRFLILKANTTHQLYDCTRVLEQHEAAQRAKVEALEKEMNHHVRQRAYAFERNIKLERDNTQLASNLATLTAERDRLRERVERQEATIELGEL